MCIHKVVQDIHVAFNDLQYVRLNCHRLAVLAVSSTLTLLS